MASDTTISALEETIGELKYKRKVTLEWMLVNRRTSLRDYHIYKIAKQELFKIDRSIETLKENLRRIKHGK